MTCALATVAIATALVAGPQCPRADRAVPSDVMAALIGGPVATRDDAEFAEAVRAVRATPNRRASR